MIRIDNDRLDIAQGGSDMPRTVTGAEQLITAPAPAPATPPPRHRWLRRFAWAIALLLILSILAAISLQLVLWSDYPRRYVVAELEQQLGLRVQAERLATTWWGHTRLDNVSLSLPLGKVSFVRVPQMDVHHTSLIPLLLQRPLTVQSLTLKDPALVVQQDRLGKWDILEVADLLTRLGGREQARASSQIPTPAAPATMILPEITVLNGSLELHPSNHPPVQITAIQLHGKPSGRLLWLYEAAAGDQSPGHPYAALKGEVAPGGTWPHQLQLDAQNLHTWLDAFVPWWPRDAAASLSWRGTLDGDRLSGLLDIQSLHALDMQAAGSLQVTSTLQQADVQPLTLTLDTPNPMLPRITLQGGTLTATREAVSARDLAISALGGTLHITADYAYTQGKGAARIAAENLKPLPVAAISGTANLSFDQNSDAAATPATQKLTVILDARADTPAGLLATTGELHASGIAFNQLTWDATLARAAWSGWPPVELTQVTAKGKLTPDQLQLASLSAKGPGTFNGTGTFIFADHTWSATLRAQGLPLVQSNDTAAISLDAIGAPDTIHLQTATITAAGITAQAAGTYVFALPKPLDLSLDFRETPVTAENFQGKLRGNARLIGTVTPLSLAITGSLLTRNITLQNRPIGDAEIALSGALTEQQLQLATTRMAAFDGRWQLAATYPFDTRRATITARVDDLSLAAIADSFHWQVITNNQATSILAGTASGTITVDGASFNSNDLHATGLIMITSPEARLPDVVLSAQSLSAGIKVANGRLQLSPEARQSAPTDAASGTLTGDITLDLQTPERLITDLHVTNWTITAPNSQPASARLNADLQATADTRTLTGTGKLSTRADLFYKSQPAGTLHADASLAGRTIDISTLHLDLLNGTASGNAAINLDNLLASTLSLSCQNIDAPRLALFHPALAEATGTFTGTLVIAPDPSPRALEPLKATLLLTNTNGAYRGLPIGKISATGYASINRLLLDRSQLELAGGTLEFWGRTIQREGYWTTNQLHLSAKSLDLNQLVQAFHPNSQEMIGKLSGEIDALGDPRRPNALSGGGTIRIDQSDLANSDIVAAIYSLMNIAALGKNADGNGRLSFRFEQGSAYITDLYYFNRGVQLRGTGRVRDITSLPRSPIDLVIAGTARPLKELRLPLVADFDEILGVLQSNVTTVRATGTLEEPRVVPMLLEQAGSDLKELLLGDVRAR